MPSLRPRQGLRPGDPAEQLADYGDINLSREKLLIWSSDKGVNKYVHPCNFPVQSSTVENGEHTMTGRGTAAALQGVIPVAAASTEEKEEKEERDKEEEGEEIVT